MASSKINLKSEKLFPFQFQLLAYILLFLGAVLFIINVVLAIILLVIAVFMLTGYSGCEFDLTNSSYREYNSFFRIRFGKWKDIPGVEKIYVNKIKSSQKMYSRANVSSVLREHIYKCFIKFSDGQKLLLTQKRNKEDVMKEVQLIAKSYGLEVIDNSY